MTRRIERVNELIRAELATLLQRETRDPRLSSLISITAVETSADLRNATVRVSIMATPEESKQVMVALRRAAGFFRKELAERLHIRQVPELTFRQDTSIEEGTRVLQLIREINVEKGSDE